MRLFLEVMAYAVLVGAGYGLLIAAIILLSPAFLSVILGIV